MGTPGCSLMHLHSVQNNWFWWSIYICLQQYNASLFVSFFLSGWKHEGTAYSYRQTVTKVHFISNETLQSQGHHTTGKRNSCMMLVKYIPLNKPPIANRHSVMVKCFPARVLSSLFCSLFFNHPDYMQAVITHSFSWLATFVSTFAGAALMLLTYILCIHVPKPGSK